MIEDSWDKAMGEARERAIENEKWDKYVRELPDNGLETVIRRCPETEPPFSEPET